MSDDIPDEPNPWEARARGAKSYRIARVLLRTCRETGFPVERLRDAHDLARAKAASMAGVRPPSDATWEAACELVEVWMRGVR